MRVRQISTVTTAMLVLAMALTSAAKNNNKSSEFPNIQIDNFGCVNPNFFRGAQPGKSDFRSLAELGVKTIIDLRDDYRREAKTQAEAAGLKYVLIPMDDRGKPTEEQIQEFMKVASDPANQPIFVHCKGGRHRTGMVTAIYRMETEGWTAAQAYGEMKKFDFSYGWGHGDLKDYVFDYETRKEQTRTTGQSTTVGTSKK